MDFQKKCISGITEMSAFKWHTSLVMTPPTPSNEPCAQRWRNAIGGLDVNCRQPAAAEVRLRAENSVENRGAGPTEGTKRVQRC